MKPDFKRLLKPRHVAVLGASPVKSPGRYTQLEWLTQAEYPGKLYPVNPRYGEVGGYKCYPGLADIPGEVDMAIMMLPAVKVVQVLREIPAGKLKFAVVITSGFSEVGETKLEQELVAVAREKGTRILGPNCMGIYSLKGRILQVPDQTFDSKPGTIGGVAQSGGNAINLMRSSINSGLAYQASVSIGNQCDINLEECLEWFYRDDNIHVITAYVEDLKHGQQFKELAGRISLKKPLIIWKGGITDQGARAANSHTGALAIPHNIWQGLIRQTGVINAEHLFDVIQISRAFEWEVLPRGTGVGVLTSGGGGSVYMTDRMVCGGLDIPLLSNPVRRKLSELIASVNTIIDNPIDLGAASYEPEVVGDTITAMARDKAIHSIVFYLYLNFLEPEREKIGHLISKLAEIRKAVDIPIYVALYRAHHHFDAIDTTRREAVDLLNDLRIPYFMDLESSIRAIRRLYEYYCFLAGHGAADRDKKDRPFRVY